MSERPKTAFVLSGGAALGAIQVGMLRALYERGIEPDLIIGTSVGALNGAYIASRPFVEQTADELAEVWRGIGRRQVSPLNPVTGFLGFFGARRHLVPDGALRELLAEHLEFDRLEQATTRRSHTPWSWARNATTCSPTGNCLDLEEPPRACPGDAPSLDEPVGHGRLQVEVELLRDRAV